MMARSSSLRNRLLSLGLAAARLFPVQLLVTFFIQHMDLFLPKDRLGENTHWVAFHHPRPDYPLHILILPKQEISSLLCTPEDDPGLFADLLLIVQEMIGAFKLDDHGYRLITNGGQNQSIPIWHWHLVCDVPCNDGDHPGVSHA